MARLLESGDKQVIQSVLADLTAKLSSLNEQVIAARNAIKGKNVGPEDSAAKNLKTMEEKVQKHSLVLRVLSAVMQENAGND